MKWSTENEMVGERVVIFTAYDDEESATVVAVSETNDWIKVRCDDGEIMVGNQWELE